MGFLPASNARLLWFVTVGCMFLWRPQTLAARVVGAPNASSSSQVPARAVPPDRCRAQLASDCPVAAAVTAVFEGTPGACDLNDDMTLSAADVVAAVLPTPPSSPTPTASPSPTPSGSPTGTTSPTATATATDVEPSVTPSPSLTATTAPPTGTATATVIEPSATASFSPPATITPTATAPPTATPTPQLCPSAAAELVFEIDNQTGVSPVAVGFRGERPTTDCSTSALATSYAINVECAGTGIITCGDVTGLAPGSWWHSISVTAPSTGQVQYQPSLLIANSTPNRVRFTAFATVLNVRTTVSSGPDTLRTALQATDSAPKPALIQFDPSAFPDGVATRITLDSALPALAADDVTIDGTDATGAVGNRVIDAAGLPISALAITGARNHIVGLRLTNAGGNNRDTLNIAGNGADGNVIERSIIEGAATADGIGVDQQAGKGFDATVNVIEDCEVSGVSDKGIKVTTGSYARVLRTWVHDNTNGGIQATIAGHVQAWQNLVERNRGGTAQNGLSANAGDEPSFPGNSELQSRANIARGNGANGISIRGFSVAVIWDDYLATNGTSGLRVFNDVGPPAAAVVTGTSAVCNGVDGAVVANASVADFGGGLFGAPGDNAFTQNNLPAGGANLRNATDLQVGAINDQWEHCGHGTTCDAAAIEAYDLSDHGAHTTIMPAQAHCSLQPPVLDSVAPTRGRRGELLRIFGSGFNVIDGHFAEDQCADVAGSNQCTPLRGNCVVIGGVPAQVEAITPTMLGVRWPFTCVEPVSLVVKTEHGGTSTPMTVCE